MKVLVLGSTGLVGNSLIRTLSNEKLLNIFSPNRSELNLFSLIDVQTYIQNLQPDYIINAAAKVGGILANNTYRADFILENLKININILESIIPFNSIKLINLGSSCIYPLNAPNPIKEEYFLTGELEVTNSPYAMAKISAIELGRSLNSQYGHNVVNLMPTNLYGPNDNFSEMSSHVIPGLIHKMHLAKERKDHTFSIWGTGTPLREFLHVDDLAKGIMFINDNNITDDLINIGSGVEISIKELAEKIQKIVGFEGKLDFDKNMPDGNPRKLLDSSKLKSYGWSPEINLDVGLSSAYNWYKKHI